MEGISEELKRKQQVFIDNGNSQLMFSGRAGLVRLPEND